MADASAIALQVNAQGRNFHLRENECVLLFSAACLGLLCYDGISLLYFYEKLKKSLKT